MLVYAGVTVDDKAFSAVSVRVGKVVSTISADGVEHEIDEQPTNKNITRPNEMLSLVFIIFIIFETPN